jgi:hypothetical protein
MQHKVFSGALQLTVFIGVLIALLLSGLILYAYTFGYMKSQSKGAIANVQLADQGINYLLLQKEPKADTTTLNWPTTENQSVKAQLSQWGVFEKAIVTTQFRTKKFIKTALMGTLIEAQKSPTLFLQDTQSPLTLVGKTTIRGIAYLPFQGVKPGYITGNSYYGTELIYGTIKQSDAYLPKLTSSTINSFDFYQKIFKIDNQEDFIALGTNKAINVSFKKHTKGFYSKDPIVLNYEHITGNVIIKSEALIKVKSNTILKDVILIAPIIEIEDNTTGNFQAIASKTILVGKNCQLNYPSALILYQDNKENPDLYSRNDDNTNQIFINSKTVFKGCVCYFQTKEVSDFQTQLILETDAVIKGEVYCNGNFNLRGTVSGSVYTKQFIASRAAFTFVNHIYDGTIENTNIPSVFAGMLFENQPKTIAKWLY